MSFSTTDQQNSRTSCQIEEGKQIMHTITVASYNGTTSSHVATAERNSRAFSGSKLIWQMSTLYPPYHDCSIHKAAELGHMICLHSIAESLRDSMKVKKWHFSNCTPHPTTTLVIFFHKPRCSGLNSSTACWSLCALLAQRHFHPWFCQISFYVDRTSNQKLLEQEWSNIVYNTQGSVSTCTALHTISESVHGLLGNHLWCNESLDTVLRTEGGLL
jgi:hypothetical protein